MLWNQSTFRKPFALCSRTFTSCLHQYLKSLVEAKSYDQIPELLPNSSHHQENPFANILHHVPAVLRIQIVDEILQSWIRIRPRSKLQSAYSHLLQCTLCAFPPFPLSLAVLQHTLRSGFSPDLPSQSKLSLAWRDCLRNLGSPGAILNEMNLLGYCPDTGTCNFIVSTLCAKDMVKEAAQIVRAMPGAGCAPDADSYGAVAAALCERRRAVDAAALMKEMVVGKGLMPRQSTIGKVVVGLKGIKEHRKAVKMVELLEERGCAMQFLVYELVVKSCAQCGDFVMAGKMMVKMLERGFIPYFKLRKMVIDGLVASGNSDLATVVYQKSLL